MQISLDAMYSLRIFDNLKKNSASLFTLFDQTRTRVGRDKLRSWFLAPLQDLGRIQERQDTVALLVDSANSRLCDELSTALSAIANIPQLLRRLRVKSLVADWKNLYTFLVKTRQIMELLERSGLQSSLFAKFDWEASLSESRMVVQQLVSPELDELKQLYMGLDQMLGKVAQCIVLPFQPSPLFTYAVVYFPQLGFLFKTPLELLPDPQDPALPTFEFQFSAQGFAYFKTADMRNLDAELGDVHSLIVDLELEIVQQVRDTIMDAVEDVLFASDALGEIDAFLSLSLVAVQHRYVRPSMTNDDTLVLEKMRHPMLETSQPVFVENDLCMGSEPGSSRPSSKALVISAPNASGKSVYLHQVALVVYLAHIGSYVPCLRAHIGITDKILTRLKSPASVSLRESTFLTDLKQVCACLAQSTPSSLVVLDEFGKGTMPSDGIGLFASTIHTLVGRGCKLLAATHFHQVLSLPLLSDLHLEGQLGYYTLTTKAHPDQKSIEFLYELVPGMALDSLGILCARNAGCTAALVDRASQIASCIARGAPIPRLDRNASVQEAAAALVDKFLGMDLETVNLDQSLDFLIVVQTMIKRESAATDAEQEETIKRLKISLHSAVSAKAKEASVQVTPEALLAMTELVFEQTKIMAGDLEAFARHAKRQNISVDDVRLLLRRHPSLLDKL
ncbi:MutS protein msh5 [Kappamyces sp. JEL0680]|nr:MutS protein msh5 [Kappamyces sp. JEL0680]